jgi:hypothetical protein
MSVMPLRRGTGRSIWNRSPRFHKTIENSDSVLENVLYFLSLEHFPTLRRVWNRGTDLLLTSEPTEGEGGAAVNHETCLLGV